MKIIEVIYSIPEINKRYNKVNKDFNKLIDLLLYENSQIYKYKTELYEILIINDQHQDDIDKIISIDDKHIKTFCNICGEKTTEHKMTEDLIKQGYLKNSNHIKFIFKTYQP